MYMSTNELSYTSDTLHSLNCSVVSICVPYPDVNLPIQREGD